MTIFKDKCTYIQHSLQPSLSQSRQTMERALSSWISQAGVASLYISIMMLRNVARRKLSRAISVLGMKFKKSRVQPVGRKQYSYTNNTVTAPQHFIAKQPKNNYTCNVDRIPCRTSCKQSRCTHSSNGECTRRRCEGLVASGDK